MRRGWQLAALLWAGGTAGGWAGIEIQAVITDRVSQPPAGYRATVRAQGQTVSLDNSRFTGEPTVVLYDAGRDVIRHVNHPRGQFMVIQAGTLGQMSDRLRSAMDYLTTAWHGPAAKEPARPAWILRATEGRATFQGMPCRKYMVASGADIRQEIWTASWEAAGIMPADFAPLRRLIESYHRMTKALGGVPFLPGVADVPLEYLLRVEGYPLIFRHFRGGRLAYEVQLGRPVRRDFPEALFTVPVGYKEAWF